jgi:hypothetical protein
MRGLIVGKKPLRMPAAIGPAPPQRPGVPTASRVSRPTRCGRGRAHADDGARSPR